MGSRIFISYRRDDSATAVGRLADRLRPYFGRENVFVDIDTLKPGEVFGEVIERTLVSCDCVLVVIGKHWLSTTDSKGRQRLDNPDDWVRLEVTTALRTKIRVIPVLVEGARLPTLDELSEDMADLAGLHAHEVRNSDFHQDVDKLIETLAGRVLFFRRFRPLIAAVAVIMVAAFMAYDWNSTTPSVTKPLVTPIAKAPKIEPGDSVELHTSSTNAKSNLIAPGPSPQVRPLIDKQADVYHGLELSVDLPPGEHPLRSLFLVKNRGHWDIGKHSISCEQNLLVSTSHTVVNGGGEVHVSESPLLAGGGTQSDPCLLVSTAPPNSIPICYDVTLSFSYALVDDPLTQKKKETRFLGFATTNYFRWSEQPVGQQASYCDSALKQRDEAHKNEERSEH